MTSTPTESPSRGRRWPWLRAGLFWLYFGANTLVLGTAAALFGWLLPARRAYRFGWLWSVLNIHGLRWIVGIDWRITGRDPIPDRAVVFLAKHQSIWETMGLVMLLPEHVHVLKRELLRVPFFGWGLAALRPIAIDRRAGRAAADQLREQGAAQLATGRSVLVFPEGTRVQPGASARYRAGGALLAVDTGTPVVPVAHNAGECWPRGALVPRAGVVDIVVGPAIDPTGHTVESLNSQVRDWIEARMAELPGAGAAADG